MEKNKLDTTNIYPYYAGIGVESDQSREQFLANLKLLPQSLTDFLISDETAGSIGNISEHYDLTDVQTEIISWLIRKVATGEEYIKDLPTSISSLVGVDPSWSIEIYSYIIKNVFAPYWEDIKKIQIQKFGNKESSPPLPKSTDFGTPNINPAGLSTPFAHAQSSPSFSRNQSHYQGEELPETGGNIIDLREVNQ